MKKIYSIVLVAALCFSLGSCKKDFLNLKPYDQVGLSDAIKTEGDMQAATNGIYTAIRSSALFGRDIQLRGDMMADNVYVSSSNSNRFLEYFQLNYTVSTASVASTWNNAYLAILRANNVINSTIVVNANTNQYKGEALTLRALLYFELVKQFAKPYNSTTAATDLGVPLVLTYDPAFKPARSTVQKVYDQIEADLVAAIGLLTSRTPYSAGYVSKYGAKAILARLYQYKMDWNKSLTNAQDVISNSGYSLITPANFSSYWNFGTLRTDKVESIFELGFDPNGNAGLESLPYLFLQSGYGDVLATDALAGMYSSTDVRASLLVSTVRAGVNVKAVIKYPTNINYTIKIMRLSEVYLIAAEASFQTGNNVQALTYLNQIARLRDPAFAGYTSTGAQVLEDILTERRKELAFEGHRYWDLVRNNRDVVRINLNGNYPGNVPLTLATSNFRRVLPLPQGELDANPNIRSQQNAGY